MLSEEQKETATHFYARLLGVSDAQATPKVLRLVRELLFDVPNDWEVEVVEDGKAKNCPYFYNTSTCQSEWQHPLQQMHQRRVDEMLRNGLPPSPEKQHSAGSSGAKQTQRKNAQAHVPDVLDLDEFDDEVGSEHSFSSASTSWRNHTAAQRSPQRQAKSEATASNATRKSVRWEDISSEPESLQQQQPPQQHSQPSTEPNVRQVSRFNPSDHNRTSQTTSAAEIEIAELKAQLERVEADLESEKRSRLSAEAAKATDILAVKQQAERAFEAQLRQLKDSHLTQLQTMEERHVGLANELQEAKLEISRSPRAAALDAEVKRLKTELDSANTAKAELQDKIDQQVRQISDLQSQNGELAVRLKLLAEQQAEAPKANSDASSPAVQPALEAALLQATQRIKQLEGEAAKAKNQMLMMEAEVRNAKSSQDSNTQQRQLDDGTIQELQRRLASLTAENDSKLAQLQSRVAELEGSSFVLQQQLQQESIAHINDQREQANRVNVLTFENHRLTEQLKSVEGQLDLTKKKHLETHSELIRSQDAHRRLQESYKNVDESRRIEQDKSQQTIAQLQFDLQTAREQLAKQQEAASKMSSDYANQVAALENEINQKIPEMAQKAILRAEANWSEKTRVHLTKLHQDYDRQCEAYRGQIQRLQETIEHIEFQLRQVRSESERSVTNYRDRCSGLQSRVQELEDQLSHSRFHQPSFDQTPAATSNSLRGNFATPRFRQDNDSTSDTATLQLHLSLLQKQCSMLIEQQHQQHPSPVQAEELRGTRSFIAGSQLNVQTPKAAVEDVSFALGGYSTPAPTPFTRQPPSTAAPRTSTTQRFSLADEEFSELQDEPVVGNSSIWEHDSIGFTRGYWRHKYTPH